MRYQGVISSAGLSRKQESKSRLRAVDKKWGRITAAFGKRFPMCSPPVRILVRSLGLVGASDVSTLQMRKLRL